MKTNNEEIAPFFDARSEYQRKLSTLKTSATCRAIQYALEGEGKLVRPTLVFLGGRLFSDKAEDSLGKTALAVEMVHTYSLIHDDLPCMDDDDLRRGRPTLHVQFDEYSALLAGDGLLTDAFSILTKLPIDASSIVDCVRILSESAGSFGMIEGQSIDLAHTGKTPVSQKIDTLELMHTLKTGYLLGASLALGAAAAGAPRPMQESLSSFGKKIGLAFQIKDDFLDSQEGVGKSLGKDAEQGKLTFATEFSSDVGEKRVAGLTAEAQNQLSEDLRGHTCSHSALAKLFSYTNHLITRSK